ncbi:hypothetical protein D1007_25625 [Hordeum vulgare]|nr:hypothetical protein D1007_25625 [Hordeum vulgare]
MGAFPSGSWEGSIMTEERIEYLRWTRKLPAMELTDARVPGKERVREPRDGERIVFGMHFDVDVGMPGRSLFPWQFLDFFWLQMLHLLPNSLLYLACFATLCEAYLGFWPFLLLQHANAQRAYLLLRLQHRLGRDWVDLPPFIDELPTGAYWDMEMCSEEMVVIEHQLRELVSSMWLVAPDLVEAFVLSQMLPL